MRYIKKQLDPESKVLFRNSSWVLFSNFFSTGLAFLRSVAIARGLGAEIYGIYAMVVGFVGLIQEFLNLNVGTALIKFGAEYHACGENDRLVALVKRSLRWSAFMAVLSVAVLALLSFTAYDRFLNKPGLEYYIIAYAVAASITYVNSISRGLLRLYFRFRLSSFIQAFMDTVETVAVLIAVIVYPRDLQVFFVAVIITRFLNGFICNLMAFWELRAELEPFRHAGPELIKSDTGRFRDFVLGNSLGNTMKTAISQGDVVLLGILAGPVSVGLYSVAKKLAYSVLTLSDPLVSSIYPQLSKLLAENRITELRKMIVRITGLAAVPGLLFVAVAFLLNRWIITTVYGVEYAAAGASFYYFVIGAVFGAVTFWTLPLVQSLGLVKMRVVAYAVTISIGCTAAWLLVPRMQAAGMSIALLLTNILNMLIFIFAADRALRRRSVPCL